MVGGKGGRRWKYAYEEAYLRLVPHGGRQGRSAAGSVHTEYRVAGSVCTEDRACER